MNAEGRMIHYKIGCNFDWSLIDSVIDLNKIGEQTKIDEFYGSDRQYAFLTARPAFRLPDVNDKDLRRYVRLCSDAGIQFNYTLNSIYPGSKRFLETKESEIKERVRFLDDIGVAIITIANPIMATFVREASKQIKIEVSTIAHIDTITQIKAWNDRFGINKVCGNLLKNRSIGFLEKAAKYCQQAKITLDLMVNEFCGTGGKTYGTHCIYRDSCYLCHAENITKDDHQLFATYPMGYCISSRDEPAAWLKMNFIRPEDVRLYDKIGIRHFKITGRTGTTEYILKIANAYIRQSWDGNLLALWKPLETISTEQNEFEFEQPYYIDNKKLSGFVDRWFKNREHDCASEVCGETCTYCESFYKKMVASRNCEC